MGASHGAYNGYNGYIASFQIPPLLGSIAISAARSFLVGTGLMRCERGNRRDALALASLNYLPERKPL
jgi:hypothetical protein